MKNKMSGYVVLLMYRYGNLCVKADPLSLLSIEGDFDGQMLPLEELAHVLLADDYTFRLLPMDFGAIPAILKGVKLTHPEFKTELKQMEGSEDPREQEIYFHMPEVDDDRKDSLTDMVKTLGDNCKSQLDLTFSSCSARIMANMSGDSDADIKARKDELQQIYDWHDEQYKKMMEEKLAEIDGAWKAWSEKSVAGEAAAEEDALSKGVDSVFKMKME